MRQPSFGPPQSTAGSKEETKTTKMLPAHGEDIGLARNGEHYTLTQTKAAKAKMQNGPQFPALTSFVAVTRNRSCYHHWHCNTLFFNCPHSPASGLVYNPSVRVVSFDDAAAYGYQRCRACIDALRGKKVIAPPRRQQRRQKRHSETAKNDGQAAPLPATPRLHPRERAEARRSTEQQPKPRLSSEELEEGEVSPPEYESEDEQLAADLRETLAELREQYEQEERD